MRPVQIVEMAPRDGLQNEAVVLSTEDKLALVAAAVDAGARRIEVTSFVHPARVPQMADADELMAALPRPSGVRYAGLVMNQRGLTRALAGGVDEVDVVVVATDTFCGRNQGMTTAQACDTAADLVAEARAAGVFTTVTVAAAFGCPFEGEVPLSRLHEVLSRVVDAGPDELALADTIGVGVPTEVTERFALARSLAGDGVPLQGAPPRHPAHRCGQRGGGVPRGGRVAGRQHRRGRWLPLRAERDRERGHRGPGLPVRPDGGGQRHGPRGHDEDGGLAGGTVGTHPSRCPAARRGVSGPLNRPPRPGQEAGWGSRPAYSTRPLPAALARYSAASAARMSER